MTADGQRGASPGWRTEQRTCPVVVSPLSRPCAVELWHTTAATIDCRGEPRHRRARGNQQRRRRAMRFPSSSRETTSRAAARQQGGRRRKSAPPAAAWRSRRDPPPRSSTRRPPLVEGRTTRGPPRQRCARAASYASSRPPVAKTGPKSTAARHWAQTADSSPSTTATSGKCRPHRRCSGRSGASSLRSAEAACPGRKRDVASGSQLRTLSMATSSQRCWRKDSDLGFRVGREGFEPPTPCASCKCSAN